MNEIDTKIESMRRKHTSLGDSPLTNVSGRRAAPGSLPASRATEERLPLPQIYARLAAAYDRLGSAGEIHRHHQGGPTGYRAREAIAGPATSGFPRPDRHQAFAWNPSLTGAKIEDTVLLGERCEPSTVDERWPELEIGGRRRPAYWVRG